MAKSKLFVVVLWMILISFSNMNISNRAEANPPPFQPINVIIILDTSDRISKEKHHGQVEIDKKIVEAIITGFNKIVEGHVAQDEKLNFDSRLYVVIPDQPLTPRIPWGITEKLTIKDNEKARNEEHKSRRSINEYLENQQSQLLGAMTKLYEFVAQHKQTGSDIWKWFRDEAKRKLSPNHQNFIICISDGYLDFDLNIQEQRDKGTYMEIKKFRNDPKAIEKIRNGEGLIPIEEEFRHFNVQFMMVEIALRGEKDEDGTAIPYQKDFAIIKAYWETWLKSMRIEDTDFIEQSNSPIGELIESFLRSGEED